MGKPLSYTIEKTTITSSVMTPIRRKPQRVRTISNLMRVRILISMPKSECKLKYMYNTIYRVRHHVIYLLGAEGFTIIDHDLANNHTIRRK